MYSQGTFTKLDYGACPTFDSALPDEYQPFGVNDSGNIVGTYEDAAPSGLLRSDGFYGTMTKLLGTGYEITGDINSGLYGLNNASPNELVGYTMSGGNRAHATVWTGAGSVTEINVPGDLFGTTVGRGVNDSGQIVGSDGISEGYANPTATGLYGSDGFVYDHGTFRRLDYPGAVRTVANGVSDTDMFESDGYYVVGTYEGPGFDPATASGPLHGYLATVYPDNPQLP